MFNRLVKKVFFPQTSDISPSKAYSFKQDPSPSALGTNSIQRKPDYLAELAPEEKLQQEFYHFLFGQSSLSAQQDELSQYIGQRLDELLQEPELLLENLPVLPGSLSEIIRQINCKEFDTPKIVNLLQQEPAIAAKVLQLANSPFYNRSGKDITDLKAAFMQLGADGLSEGVINGFISRLMPQSDAYFRLYGQKLWRHSLHTGDIARQLEMVANKDQAPVAYLAGLLSNLGDIIIYQLMLDGFTLVHPDITPGSALFIQLLQRHSKKLTYLIAQYWQFPSSIQRVLAIQAKLHSSALLPACQQQNPLACYLYEARLISQLKLKHEYESLAEDDVFTVLTSLLHSNEAKDYLSYLSTYQWQHQA